jgi:uroporphyrin-III C-methyltransferase
MMLMAKKKAQVYLIGAGPGNPKLLTLRAKEVLEESVDVVLYDRLVSKEILKTIPGRVRLTDVGKEPYSKNGVTQDEIIGLMISLVREGKTVARLKGGDALFFSRGSEEACALKRSGVRYEIVPGVSSVMGATAYAGIPLTHREYSSSVLVATGQEGQGKGRKKRIDWRRIPSSSVDTIVLLMGAKRFSHIATELILGGLDPSTPVAAIEWGTTTRQRTRLFKLSQQMVSESLHSPSLIVIGQVVNLAKGLSWLEDALLLESLEENIENGGDDFAIQQTSGKKPCVTAVSDSERIPTI